jgi:nucleotide-binding universal stress UspA family protein
MAVMRPLLLATDFRDSSQKAAAVAVKLAKQFSVTVVTYHVLDQAPSWPATSQDYQDQLMAYLTRKGVDATDVQVGVGSPTEHVLRYAEETDPGLLLIGAGDKQRDGKLVVGPVTESILTHTTQPTLAVNPFGPAVEFRTLLVAVDHSRTSRRALEDAARLARAFGSKLIVLTVVPAVTWLEAVVETGQLTDARLEHKARWVTEFEAFLADIPLDGVTVEKVVREGAPDEQIDAAAKELGADLLVMGATGRTGLAQVLMGSVTRRVLRNLPCSLLLIKDDAVFEDRLTAALDVVARATADARAALGAGDVAAAAGLFRRALALDPYHLPALDGLVAAQEKLGHPTDRYAARAARLRARGE